MPIHNLIALFKSSDEPEREVTMILRAQAAFWLIGATDGHAKNFSLSLRPGGHFRMTPLYDVMSAEPSVAAGQITRRQAKLAMSLGQNRHYRLDEIMPRHLEQTAALAHVDPGIVRDLYREFVALVEAAASRLADETQGRRNTGQRPGCGPTAHPRSDPGASAADRGCFRLMLPTIKQKNGQRKPVALPIPFISLFSSAVPNQTVTGSADRTIM